MNDNKSQSQIFVHSLAKTSNGGDVHHGEDAHSVQVPPTPMDNPPYQKDSYEEIL